MQSNDLSFRLEDIRVEPFDALPEGDDTEGTVYGYGCTGEVSTDSTCVYDCTEPAGGCCEQGETTLTCI